MEVNNNNNNNIIWYIICYIFFFVWFNILDSDVIGPVNSSGKAQELPSKKLLGLFQNNDRTYPIKTY